MVGTTGLKVRSAALDQAVVCIARLLIVACGRQGEVQAPEMEGREQPKPGWGAQAGLLPHKLAHACAHSRSSADLLPLDLQACVLAATYPLADVRHYQQRDHCKTYASGRCDRPPRERLFGWESAALQTLVPFCLVSRSFKQARSLA